MGTIYVKRETRSLLVDMAEREGRTIDGEIHYLLQSRKALLDLMISNSQPPKTDKE